ncbi:8587_t:CDS:2 [Gigaspora margarita]|uniref:8587_t:CDS:1 n=1 Tax=Gigaspora margarita TaxID=4874 RepID=A0ABN7VWH0_GIGMA|nr:8587_t:CDS:2 [Gigaspora margarita]
MTKHHFLNANINNKILPLVVLIPTQTSMTKFTPSNSNISGNTGGTTTVKSSPPTTTNSPPTNNEILLLGTTTAKMKSKSIINDIKPPERLYEMTIYHLRRVNQIAANTNQTAQTILIWKEE